MGSRKRPSPEFWIWFAIGAAIIVLFAAYLAIDDLGIAALASPPADRRGEAALRCRHCFRLIKRPQ